jgi:hypothetical protein
VVKITNEEDQLRALLDRQAITPEEYKERFERMREKANEIHKRKGRPPKSTADIPGVANVDQDQLEKVFKFTFEYREKKWSRSIILVTIEKEWFAEGAMRYAYRGTDWTQTGDDAKFVAKSSKEKGERTRTYFIDVEMQGMCQYFAGEFNARGTPKKVTFIEAYVIERYQLDADNPLRIMGCEKELLGDYQKFNNNWGWMAPDERNTPQAFSHFSWWHSNGQYIVVDVQGVGDVYTDPQVHSADGKGFGKGNVGKEGIDQFFTTHKCNSVCKILGLTDKIEDFVGTAEEGYVPEHLDYNSTPTDQDLAFFNLERPQYEHIVRSFKESDADSSGELSIAELPSLCRKLGIEIPTNELLRVLTIIDRDHSGEISLLEFLFWWTGHEP